MNWITIERGKWGGTLMPDNVIRLRKTSMAVSPNVSENFTIERKTLDDGRETVKLGIAVDPDVKAIKLVRNDVGGFVFSTNPSAGSKVLSKALPSAMRKMELPKGDYVLTDKENLVFKLAE